MTLNKKLFTVFVLNTFLTTNAFAKTPLPPQVSNYSLQITETLRAQSLHQGAQEITVAIIDTGIDVSHPALKEHLWRNLGEVGIDSQGRDKSKNGVDDDGNGYIDDVHGWNFAANTSELRDLHGHGTHIAGIIQSVAPKANLMILKFYDPKSGGAENLANTVKAIEYAVKMKAKIINYSGGGITKYPEEEKALRKAEAAGILFVAAAGNEKSNSDVFGFYPADYELSNIISVTAIDENRQILPSSNYGKNTVDIAAPGKDIISSLPGGKYGRMSGTSQATAFVSGVAALLFAESPGWQDPERIIQQLTNSGSENEFLKGKTKHQTTLNAYRSLAMKDTGLSAFGVLSTNLESHTFLEFSDLLNQERSDAGQAELPFKTLSKNQPLP